MVTTRSRRVTNKRSDDLRGGINSILLREIMFNILVRLPAYAADQIKTVCKMWFDIIKSREFVVANLEYWRSRPEFISISKKGSEYYLGICEIETKKMPYQIGLGKYEDEDMYLMSSLDGLILFIVAGSKKLYICNPLTQNYKLLLYAATSRERGWSTYTLVFDSVHQIYKVIGLFYQIPNLCIDEKYCVVSLSNDERRRRTRGDIKVPVWRNVDDQFRHFTRASVVYVPIGNVLYWVACSIEDRVSYIQTMDIVDEVFSDKIDLPIQPADVHWGACRLFQMESRKSLCFVIPSSNSELGIWVLESGEEYKWIKKHNIILETIVGRPQNLSAFTDYKFDIHSAVDTEDSNSTKLIIRFQNVLYTYNIKSREMSMIIRKFSSLSYVSSFISWEKDNSANG